ncbi:hypothetical protein D3C72_1209290 [compost metagenome]
MFPWVGFANNPLSLNFKQISQAKSDSSSVLITIAFKSPFPRTSVIKLFFSAILFNPSLKITPKRSAFSASFSSLITSRAAIATAAATGFPPKVEPCCPGLITFMISSLHKTAETG